MPRPWTRVGTLRTYAATSACRPSPACAYYRIAEPEPRHLAWPYHLGEQRGRGAGVDGRSQHGPVPDGVVALLWGVSHLETVSQLRATERAEEFHPAAGMLVAEHGVGPLRIDVLQVNDGRTVRVPPPPGGHAIGDERRELRVSDNGGAYYPASPPPDGLWLRFAGLTAASLLVGLAMVVVAIRPLGEIIFGQRDPSVKSFGWLPANGSHGGTGGQAPPYVPYNPDWDATNRKRQRGLRGRGSRALCGSAALLFPGR